MDTAKTLHYCCTAQRSYILVGRSHSRMRGRFGGILKNWGGTGTLPSVVLLEEGRAFPNGGCVILGTVACKYLAIGYSRFFR